MTISALEVLPHAVGAAITEDALSVSLSDGRTISVPLAWFPRLLHGKPAERADWRVIGDGAGLHWPALDEDISVESLLAGHKSSESAQSLAQWLAARS